MRYGRWSKRNELGIFGVSPMIFCLQPHTINLCILIDKRWQADITFIAKLFAMQSCLIVICCKREVFQWHEVLLFPVLLPSWNLINSHCESCSLPIHQMTEKNRKIQERTTTVQKGVLLPDSLSGWRPPWQTEMTESNTIPNWHSVSSHCFKF